MILDDVAGVAHCPAGEPAGAVLLTHGAGGNRDAPMLQRLCAEWAGRGWLAIRYNLPFRRNRPTGPPSGSGAADRAGIVAAIRSVRERCGGPLIAGGHSYGGRQTSMAVAAGAAVPDLLALFSYPVHPPGQPQRTRTGHFPQVMVPTVFVHGGRDPFGTLAEVRAAAALVAAPTGIVEIGGARHDLASTRVDVPALAVDAALAMLR